MVNGFVGPLIIGSPEVLARVLASVAKAPCPDCNAGSRYWTDTDGVHHVTIEHDDTCPAYNAGLNRAQRRAKRRKK